VILRAIPPIIHGKRVVTNDMALLVLRCDNCGAEFTVYHETKTQDEVKCDVCSDTVVVMPRLMEAAWDKERGLWGEPEDVRVLKTGLIPLGELKVQKCREFIDLVRRS